jgi:serine/threonine protein kinase
MIACNLDLPRRFLSDSLSESDSQQFECHLETCSRCRAQLDLEAGGEGLEIWVREQLASSSEVPLWSETIGAQEGHSPKESTVGSFASDAIAAAELAILSPTDDRASMGRLGPFEVRAVIGRGGMGTVYKAIDPSLGRMVAIKVLKPELANIGSARQRFSLESRAMAAITHSNVVPIYAVDEHRGLPYLAMEYVSGGTLEARLRKSGPLETLSIVRIGLQIAQALNAAHDCGLVHRDIKPGNILIDRGIDRIRVADFGLVRVSDDASMTHSGLITGTPQFMAPEQVRGEACDGRADLFSLGCVLYALCVGHPPFRADSPYAAMQRIVHDTERPIREIRPEVPVWLASMIHRLLAKEPGSRFESASMLSDILEQELAYSQNPTRLERPRRDWMTFEKPRKRTKVVLIALAAVFVVSAMSIASNRLWLRNADFHSVSIPQSSPQASSDSISMSVEVPETRGGRSVGLWTEDGYRDAVQLSRFIQATLHTSQPLIDPLDVDLETLKQQIREYERREP